MSIEETGEGKTEFDSALDVYIRKGWPPSLAKAAVDPFEYACEVHGRTYYFQEAQDAGNGWVTLLPARAGDHDAKHIEGDSEGRMGFDGPPCPRGIDVRLSDIVWCADAPHGS